MYLYRSIVGDSVMLGLRNEKGTGFEYALFRDVRRPKGRVKIWIRLKPRHAHCPDDNRQQSNRKPSHLRQ